MTALVVYESFWGNTAAIAKAIAEGMGPDVPALTTSEAGSEALAGVDLIVAGAPLMGFSLPTEGVREQLRSTPGSAPQPDLAHQPMREWLAALPSGSGRGVAFETRFKWSPGSATKTLESGLRAAGYPRAAERGRFLVTGRYGPLKDGEIERARAWGAQLATLVE